MIVSFSTYIQGAFIQALVKDYNKRGLIFDDTNLSILEKNIYGFGKNKVIFNDLKKMMFEISNFLKKKTKRIHLDYGKNLEEFDPFGDYSGGQRIGIFIKTLLENFNNKKNTDECIKRTLNIIPIFMVRIKFMKHKIFITGAAGFVGSHLTEKLIKKSIKL